MLVPPNKTLHLVILEYSDLLWQEIYVQMVAITATVLKNLNYSKKNETNSNI